MSAARELRARLAGVEKRVRLAVERRRASEPGPEDPFLGMHVSPEAAWRLLERRAPDAAEPFDGAEPSEGEEPFGEAGGGEGTGAAEGPCPVLDVLAERFGLSLLDVGLLLVAVLPDADRRFEQLYGFLNDDVGRRRATAGLAFELLGLSSLDPRARARLAAGSPLVGGGLLLVEEPERPFLGRSLRVPDRITAHLLGDDSPDAALHGLLAPAPRPPADGGPAAEPVPALAAALGAGVRLVHLRERAGGSATATGLAALAAAGMGGWRLDLAALAAAADPAGALPLVAREVRLSGGGLLAGPVEALEGPELRRLIGGLARLPVPVLLAGTGGWDPLWSEHSPLTVAAGAFTPADRAAWFRAALGDAPLDPGLDLAHALAPYHLGPDAVGRAAGSARLRAGLESAPVAARHLTAGVRGQNAAGLERLARRIEPAVGWDDLVLPPATRRELDELALRARHRERVLGDWRMRPGGGRGRGVMALFAGDSGTGKTMSAEVVAGELGLDLYVVDLSTVVDKFVGETEKNLERIFTEAAGVNGVLLFDEADAVFGKRSEVKDAHDRYANMESAYLLQRMESFDGIAVLTTNLRANLDEAFTRRLDVIVDFPVPDTAHREALWDRCLGPVLPRADDLDLAFCARFELAGGSIRACVVTAAYLAAEAGRPVTTADLVAAVEREYRKLGRLVLAEEFARHG
ncbi:ATP-binding protein [Kitasatospora sp. NPDC004240]